MTKTTFNKYASVTLFLAAGTFSATAGANAGILTAGALPGTCKTIYAAGADAPRAMSLQDAKSYCADLRIGEFEDWHVPTKKELNVLFQNRKNNDLKGKFNLKNDPGFGRYHSSTTFYTKSNEEMGYQQNFNNGKFKKLPIDSPASVRCVRQQPNH